MVSDRYIVIHGEAKDAEEAIRLCGNALKQKGIVGDSFIDGCVNREKEYPTGLPTQIPTAIPHCKDDSVQRDAICLLKLKNPVLFRRMDDDTKSVNTQMVFNLAIRNPNKHIEVLMRMMDFLNDKEVITRCMDLSDDDVCTYLSEHLDQGKEA